MHRTEAGVQPLLRDRHFAEVEIVGIAVVRNVICLEPIAKPLVLPTVGLELTLCLHLAGLLVGGEVLSQNPRLLPDVAAPAAAEELVGLHIRALLLGRRDLYMILATKELQLHCLHEPQ